MDYVVDSGIDACLELGSADSGDDGVEEAGAIHVPKYRLNHLHPWPCNPHSLPSEQFATASTDSPPKNNPKVIAQSTRSKDG